MSRCDQKSLVYKGERIQWVAIFQRERQRTKEEKEVSGINQQQFFTPKERRRCKLSSLCGQTRGSQRYGVYLGRPLAPSYLSPYGGGGGGGLLGLSSANEYSYTQEPK
jgi:hypothetical protein